MRTPPALAALLLPALALGACDSKRNPQADAVGPSVHILSPKMDQTLAEGGPFEAMLDVQNYAMTGKVDKDHPDANGQHIHLIVDNEPYLAVYDATKAVLVEAKLMTPGTHVLRAFPSAGPKDEKGAAHHESRKNAGAFAWVRFHVKGKDGPLQDFDGSKPTLTYSRPKGDYKVGSPEHRKFLVDFYISPSIKLGRGDMSVRALLDGKPPMADGKELSIVEWKPYFIDSPTVGEHTLALELLDADGKKVDGPFNSTTRKFTVSN